MVMVEIETVGNTPGLTIMVAMEVEDILSSRSRRIRTGGGTMGGWMKVCTMDRITARIRLGADKDLGEELYGKKDGLWT